MSELVAVLSTCLADAFAPEVAAAAMDLVAGTGARPEAISHLCCGQPAWNAGHPLQARHLARALLRRLAGYDRIVVPSGSCAAMLLHVYPELFSAGDPARPDARFVAERTVELTRYLLPSLDRIPWEPETPSAVALHTSCHAIRGAGAGGSSERCLAAAGCPLLRQDGATECCGFGGLFAVNQAELSTAMADRKLDALCSTGTDTVVSSELGCLLHLEGRAHRRGLPLHFRHLAEVLRDRWSTEGPSDARA